MVYYGWQLKLSSKSNIQKVQRSSLSSNRRRTVSSSYYHPCNPINDSVYLPSCSSSWSLMTASLQNYYQAVGSFVCRTVAGGHFTWVLSITSSYSTLVSTSSLHGIGTYYHIWGETSSSLLIRAQLQTCNQCLTSSQWRFCTTDKWF